jgi:hypothetical protein
MVRRDGGTLVTSMTSNGAESPELEDDGEPPRPFELESYTHLLRTAPVPARVHSPAATVAKRAPRAHGTVSTGAIIDAIIVPTARSADQLRSAVRLAAQLRCQLIAQYTNGFPDGLPAVLAQLEPGRATALALPSEVHHPLLDLASTLPQSRVSACADDISRKRNLGLLIGRSCGWTRVLFLDDDIRKLSADKVSSAAALIDQYPVVGLQVAAFPDASVVGHARRRPGGKPFISGGSMLVNPQRMRGFFPPVYHEDWLCIMDHLRLGEVAVAGNVAQLRYRPFTTTARAQLEEFGEILALGLLWLVHAQRESLADDQSYWHRATVQHFWRDILQQRSTLLDELSKRLRHDQRISALNSVQAARTRCDELLPEEFVEFIEKWLASLAIWRVRLSCIPRAHTVTKALAELGLLDSVTVHDPPTSGMRAAARRIGTRIGGLRTRGAAT